MSNNDQWFEPGDKVMRVAYAEELGLPSNGRRLPETEFGKILCVSYCTVFEGYTVGHFVGIEGFEHTDCFRKVEEIRLCVDALKHSKSQEFQTH